MTWGFIDGRVYVPESKGDIPHGWEWLINALEAGGELYYKGKILYKKENTMKMDIKKDVFYRTKCNDKVRIYATDGGGQFPIHGAVYGKDDVWRPLSFKENGQLSITLSGMNSSLDIVDIWKDEITFDWSCLPAWADRFIAMDDDGEWVGYGEEPTASPEEGFWFTPSSHMDGTICTIPKKYSPTGFTGDWTESLMKNPKYK